VSTTPLPSARLDASGATLFLDAEVDSPQVIPLPHGTAAVLSFSHPVRGAPNQDAAAIIPTKQDEALLAVADGMGGTRRGGAAAGALVSHLAEEIASAKSDQHLRGSILDGIERANRHLLREIPDAGTTLAAVEISEHTVRPYHIGDSVILIVGQRGKLKLRTVSHSPVGLALEAGLLSEEEALHHNERNLILNAVGCPEMRIELGAPVILARHDTVLLASDGLTDNLHLDEIIAIIRKGPLPQAVAGLAALARERMLTRPGGRPSKPDDLTIVAYRRSR